jgi:hypothetical protein
MIVADDLIKTFKSNQYLNRIPGCVQKENCDNTVEQLRLEPVNANKISRTHTKVV